MMNKARENINDFSRLFGQRRFDLHMRQRKTSALLCRHCVYVNEIKNHFCTNCGYPLLQEEGDFKLFRLRSKQRSDLLSQVNRHILRARVMLYVASAFFLASFGFLFSVNDRRYALTLAGVVLAALFFLLARWSTKKPFTAMLTSFIVVLTFCTITIFGEFLTSFSTVQGLYSIVCSMIMIYFLLRAVQAAYKGDLLKEEMEVH